MREIDQDRNVKARRRIGVTVATLLCGAVAMTGIALAAPAKTKTFAGNGGLPKPIDHEQTLTQPLKIKAKGKIRDVNVRVALATGANQDYTFLLRHPSGKTIHLASGVGGFGNGFGSGNAEGCESTVTFDDEAETPIHELEGVETLVSGAFSPEQHDEVTHTGGLQELDGRPLQGRWELIVTDTEQVGLASLKCFQVQAKYKPAPKKK